MPPDSVLWSETAVLYNKVSYRSRSWSYTFSLGIAAFVFGLKILALLSSFNTEYTRCNALQRGGQIT